MQIAQELHRLGSRNLGIRRSDDVENLNAGRGGRSHGFWSNGWLAVSTATNSRLQEWTAHVFDHALPAGPKAKEWYWADDAPEWEGPREEIPPLISETFERSDDLLARFSDAQLDQGFWYLFGPRSGDFSGLLLEASIPLSIRVRAIRSFTPLFAQLMAVRCSPDLGHLDKISEGSLNSSCYMWWDWLWFELGCEIRDGSIAAEITAVLRRQLVIPHDACRESALHGIGHWVKTIPDVAQLVDEFLAANPTLRPELAAYAEKARRGEVL